MKARFWIILSGAVVVLFGLFFFQYRLLTTVFDSETSALREGVSSTLSKIIDFNNSTAKEYVDVIDSLQYQLIDDYTNPKSDDFDYKNSLQTTFWDSVTILVDQRLQDSFPDLEVNYGLFLRHFAQVDSVTSYVTNKLITGGLTLEHQLFGNIDSIYSISSNSIYTSTKDTFQVSISNGYIIQNEQEIVLKAMQSRILVTVLIALSLLGFFGYTAYLLAKLNRTLQNQKDFVDNIIHEFQTPITSIQLASKQLTQQSLQQFIIGQTQRLSRLIDQIKNGQWSEQKLELNPKAVDLFPLVQKLLANYRLQYFEEQIQFQFQGIELPYISLIDENYFLIVLQNLLDNAIVHNNRNVEIQVELYEKDTQNYLRIKDNGKGIAAKWQQKVFEKYERANANAPGLGIGLHLCKYIVEEHSGSITLENTALKGASFLIQIPSYDS